MNLFEIHFGARPIRREIQKSIEDPLSEIILSYENISGEIILVDSDGEEIIVTLKRKRKLRHSPD